MAKLKLAGKPLDFRMREMWARGDLSRGLLQAAGALGAFTPVLALANPTGGQVVAGSATIGTAGSNGVVVNQNSQRAAINWQQFSIGANEYVQFNQPNSSSVVLNRVTGNNPSSIFGSIRANGQVFLINPNGILFAPGSTLDVSSLTASTLDISNSNFMAGRYVFAKDPGAPDATVINQGSINVTPGGYVVLSGDYVENDGVIQAQSGKVLLAAGSGTTLTLDNGGGLISYKIDAPTLARLAGVDNTGSIVANGGMVVMTADVANALTATAVNNSGLITAHSVSQQGGVIELLSAGGGIENSGTLDASATQSGVAGGTVILHGDGHTQLTDTSVIDAAGDGAKGGFIELSGHTLGVRGAITAGKGGSLLLDPSRINIIGGNNPGLGTAATNSVGTSFIASKLNAGSNVAIVASHEIEHIGGTGITATTGAGNLTLEIGTVGCPTGICVGGSPAISPGQGVIDIIGLPINIKGNLLVRAAGAASAGGQISTDNLKAASISIIADKITVDGNLTATAGDITLFGHSGNSDVATVTGTVNAAGAFKASFSNEGGAGIGSVSLHGVTAQGISVMASHILVATGTLHATGTGEAAASHRDVILKSQHEFTSAGGADINVGNVISDNGSVTLTASGNGASVGNITVSGNITAARNVTISASGHLAGEGMVDVTGSISAGRDVIIEATQITTGTITAGSSVELDANGNFGSAEITVNGAIHANSSVSLDAHGSYGGDVKVTGAVVSSFGGVTIRADNTRGISGGDISMGDISASGKVTVFSRGGGGPPPPDVLTFGNITAGGEVSIDVAYIGSTQPLVVQTGAISAGAIKIKVAGHAAKFTAPSLKATGSSSSGGHSCECIPVHHGFITGQVIGSHGSSSFNVTGAVKSLNGNISLSAGAGTASAGGGTVSTGNITAGGSVVLTGTDIQVGSVTASSFVSITGNSRSAAAHITATGLVKGRGVFINANGNSGGYGSFGASVDLQGGVTATGTVGGSFSSGEVGIHIVAKNISTLKMNITTGALQAAGGSISVIQQGGSGGVTINGTVNASDGDVDIETHGSGGANGGAISVGSITAPHGNVTLEALNSGGGGANIKVNGGITAAGIDIATSASTGGNITVTGGLTATSGNIFVAANSSGGAGGSGGNIHVSGATKASSGSVSFFARGAGHSGGNITVHKVTAATGVFIEGSYAGTTEAGTQIKVQTGNVSGEYVDIEASGPAPTITTGTITATGTVSSSTGGHDYVKVLLHPFTATAGQGSISIGGLLKASGGDISIEANGGAVNTAAITASGGSADVDVSGSTIHVGGAINAIGGSVCLTGESASSQAMKITVTGNINAGMVQVNANPATGATTGASIDLQGKVTSSLSGGIMIAAVTAANVNTQITIGSMHASGGGHIDVTQMGGSGGIVITGPITATNEDVSLSVTGGDLSAGAITAKNITLTNEGAAGGGITVTGDLTASSSVSIQATGHTGANIKVTGNIFGSDRVTLNADAGSHSGGNVKVTGLISASSGTVSVTAKGGAESGGRIKLGAVDASAGVTIEGDYVGGSPGFTLQTGKITAENIIVTMTGKDPVMTVAGAKATGLSSPSGFVQLQLNPTGNSGSIDVTAGIVTAHGQVDLSGSHGVINLGNNSIVTGGSGKVLVQGGQVHLGSISAGGGISITAVAVSGHAGSITAGATTLMTGKYVKLDLSDSAGTKGVIAIGGATATGTTGSSLGGKVIINANMGTKKVTVSTVALTAVTSIDVSINNISGSASLGKLNAPAVHVSITNGNLTVGQLVKAGASLTASNGSITDTTTGSLNLVNDKFNTAHGVHLKAGTNITLTNDSFGSGGLSASAGGKLVETSAGILDVSAQVLKAKQLVLSAATIELGAATLTASSIQLSATSINNASGNGTITAAKGTIHATQGIFLVNENIVVSGAGPLISAASVDIDNAVVTGTGTLSVNATGNLDASGLHVTAGGFTAHGGSVDLTGATIAATKAVSIKSGKDVNISAAQIAGSAVGISAGRNITNGSSAGALTAGAGGLTLKAKSDVQLSGEKLTIGTGTGLISAAGSLGLAGATLAGGGTATLHAGTDISLTGATLTLGGVTMTAVGGSLDLTGVTANVTGQMSLHAKQDIILSGVHITTGIFAASASGTIHNGGAAGAITAAGMKFDAKKDIDLSSTVLTIGAGAVTGVTGDTALLQLLAAAGLKPASAAPNGAFMAGGSLTLGDLTITGDYLVLQGSSVSILGKVTAPTSGLLVEVRPGDPAASIGVEGQPGKSGIFNLSSSAFFALFPGDTIVIGDDAEAGDVTIGANGPFVLAGGTNLLFDTTGTITGLGNITGTGLVGSLETVAGSSGGGNVVTAGEIDPSTTTTSLGDQTDKKHLGHGGQGLGNGEGQNGIIGTDTNPSSVCH